MSIEVALPRPPLREVGWESPPFIAVPAEPLSGWREGRPFIWHPDRACAWIQYTLEPGQSDRLWEAVRPKMLPDIYRFKDKFDDPYSHGTTILTSIEVRVKR